MAREPGLSLEGLEASSATSHDAQGRPREERDSAWACSRSLTGDPGLSQPNPWAEIPETSGALSLPPYPRVMLQSFLLFSLLRDKYLIYP